MREERRHGLVPTLAERNFIALSGATRNVTPDRVGRDLLADILHVDTRILKYVLFCMFNTSLFLHVPFGANRLCGLVRMCASTNMYDFCI